MNLIENFVEDCAQWGLPVAWHNFRFQLGYWIGGFTHAYKDTGEGEGPLLMDYDEETE